MANMGDSQATVSVTLYSNGSVINNSEKQIPLNGQTSFVLGESLDISHGWVKIESDQILVGFGGIASSSPDNLLADIPLVEALSKKLVLPHVVNDSMWSSDVIICNPNNQDALLYFDFYSSSGELLYTKLATIENNWASMFAISGIVNDTEQAGRLTIRSSEDITAFSLYNNVKAGGTYYTGINAVIVD